MQSCDLKKHNADHEDFMFWEAVWSGLISTSHLTYAMVLEMPISSSIAESQF